MKLTEVDIRHTWRAIPDAGPIRGTRANAPWRPNADSWSVHFDFEKGTWYDHRDSVGGGVLALVQHALKIDQHGALDWLETHCGLDPRRPLTDKEQAQRRQQQAEFEDARYFGIAAAAIAETLLDQSESDDPARQALTEVAAAVRPGSNLLRDEYLDWRDREPRLTAGLVDAGRKSEARIQRRLAAFIAEDHDAA